mmetsp:Transcript_48088/g.35290  ORF Transcript_48088/g.35290 Transcript_48088/m.35290 type:complete len:147 (-) Transcript_48088:16-456(-)
MMFPNLDFSYSYPSINGFKDKIKHQQFLKNTFDLMEYHPYFSIGSLVPHVRFLEAKSGASTLREYFSHRCISTGQPLFFIIGLGGKWTRKESIGNYKVLENCYEVINLGEWEVEEEDRKRFMEGMGLKEGMWLVYRSDGHLIAIDH